MLNKLVKFLFNTLGLYFDNHFGIINKHTLLTACDVVSCLSLVFIETSKNHFLRTYFAFCSNCTHTEKWNQRKVLFLAVPEVHSVEQVFNAYHATNKLVSHVMCKLSVCLEPPRFFVIDNLHALDHIEP